MFSKSPACSRAVQRRLQVPKDSIWVSEDALAQAFQRFCIVAVQPRRHGSFVPGPMESQKRLGKRKLTHVSSESAHSPAQSIGALWGFPHHRDMDEWQWQAPSSAAPPAERDERSSLPKWLGEFSKWLGETSPTLETEEDVMATQKEHTIEVKKRHSDSRYLVKEFIRSLETARVEDVGQLCETFNLNFQQSVSLGLISDSILSGVIKSVSRNIQNATPNKSLRSSRLFLFYQSTWGGIRSSNVLNSSDLESTGLQCLLAHISKLPLDIDAQNLTVDILQVVTTKQLNAMKQELIALKDAWEVYNTNRLFTNEGKTSQELSSHAEKAGSDVNLLEQGYRFALALSSTLAPHSRELAYKVIKHFTRFILPRKSDNGGTMAIPNETRVGWLSMLAKSSWVNPITFVKLVRKMNLLATIEVDGKGGERATPWSRKEARRMTLDEICNVFIEYLLVEERVNVLESGQSVASRRQLLWMFSRLEPDAIYIIFKSLAEAGVHLHRSFVNILLEKDHRAAIRLLEAYAKLPKSRKPLHHDYILVSLIKNPNVHPHDIWRAVKLPMCLPGSTWYWNTHLNQVKIALIRTMASAFAQATSRPSRVVLRNVAYCYLYLCSQGHPVTPEVARAFTSVGIKREFLEKGHVDKSKLQWILNIIKRGEGPRVAHQVNVIMETMEREVKLRNRASL